MTAPAMRDAGSLRDVLVDALRVELPRKVELLRVERGWTDAQMPHAEQITSGEPADDALTAMGATWVLVSSPRLLTNTCVDIDARGLPVYLSRYACQVQVWAKAADQETVLAARDRLTLAVKMALLEWPNLMPGTRGDSGFRLHRTTYTERFLRPRRLTDRPRLWAPSLLSVDVEAEEGLAASTRPPLGTAETTRTDGYVVGPDQPMTGETSA